MTRVRMLVPATPLVPVDEAMIDRLNHAFEAMARSGLAFEAMWDAWLDRFAKCFSDAEVARARFAGDEAWWRSTFERIARETGDA